MRPVRAIANFLYHITRIASLLFTITALYALVIMMLSMHTGIKDLPIEIKDGSFVIFYPFTRSPFLLGDYTTSYLVTTIMTVALYGIFLWLLSAVFKAFRQQRLFVPVNVSRLHRFYLFNFIMPVVFLLCLISFGLDVRDALIIVFLHLMIGVFAFFMAAIFKQGLVLQEEQDLTL